MSVTEKDIIILLQDYMNILPSGGQEAYASASEVGDPTEHFPLNKEALRRMGKNPTGDTYRNLDIALNLLNGRHPLQYNEILRYYLHPDAGHSDLKSKPYSDESVALHDMAIRTLAFYMSRSDISVDHPKKALATKGYESMEDKHNELYTVYKRYLDDSYDKDEAYTNAAFHLGYADMKWVRKIIRRREALANG